MKHRVYDSPIGTYVLVVEDGALTGVYQTWWGAPNAPAQQLPASLIGERDDTVAAAAAAQLDEYFAGTRREFDLDVVPHGTEFQRAVWQAIAAIPFGQTRTYGDIAAELHSSPRAVGGACGRNPHSVVVPCHRVVAADQSLRGYGGGVETKEWLLAHEGVRAGG